MQRHIPKRHSTVLRLERQLFHNAHNLLIDACILYRAESFPTAFALAVLAYEELGKLHLVDHVGTEARLSEPASRREQLESLFSRRLAYSHIVKQRWALSLTKDGYSDLYHDGRLDQLKQAAFYVGFRNGRIRLPERLSSTTAYNQIKRASHFLSAPRISHFWISSRTPLQRRERSPTIIYRLPKTLSGHSRSRHGSRKDLTMRCSQPLAGVRPSFP